MTAESGATVFYQPGATGLAASIASGSTAAIDGIDNGNGTITAYAYTPTKFRSTNTTSLEYNFRLPQPVSTATYNGYASGLLELGDAVPGASIYYTVNGTVPTQTNALFSTPLVYSNSTKVYAKAFKPGYLPSGHVSAWVNQLPAPKIATSAGVLTANTTVNNAVDVWLVPNFGFDNNYGENRDGSAWSGSTLTYLTDAPSTNFPGSLAGQAPANVVSVNAVGVSGGRVYSQQGWYKRLAAANSYNYGGVRNYDINNYEIRADDVNEINQRITWLTQSLVNGATSAVVADETVYYPLLGDWSYNMFVPLTNFSRTTSLVNANQTNSLRDIFQTVEVATNLAPYVSSVNTGTKTLQLSIPYAGPTLPVGTVVTRRSAGGTYQYQLIANVLTPTTWTSYNTTYTCLRSGTELVKLMALLSYSGSGSNAVTGLEFWEGYQSDRPKLAYTLDGTPGVYEQTPVAGPVKLVLNGNHQGVITLGQRGTYYIDSPLTKRTIHFKVAAPVLGVTPSGGNVIISATTITTGAEIRYTTDGSEPTASSTLYSSAVTVTNTATTRWKGFKINYDASEIVTRIPSGPIAEWRLDETGGYQAADTSGNGNTGTLVNAPAWLAGVQGNSLRFNAAQQTSVSMGNPSLLNQNFTDLSLSFWLFIEAYPATSDARLVGKGISVYGVTFHTDGKAWFYVNSAANYCGATVSQNAWHHIAATFDGTAMKLYVDGTLAATKANSTYSSTGTGGTFTLGGPTSFFPGKLDLVRVYDRALSASEVTALGQGDIDGDGLPDAWELQYFGNLNQTGSADTDGDGQTNAQEYAASRNPAVADPAGGPAAVVVFTPLK